ncbi:aspartyl-phosphate phosphatase Spo0E family protein [Priestia megaterium]
MNTNNVNKSEEKKATIQEIEFIREVMIYTAFKEGIKSNNTLKISIMLDQLLNKIQKN